MTKNDTIKIMHIIGDLDRAGAQEVVRTLVEYLKTDDCTPVVCTLRDGPLRPDIEELGIPVEVLGPRRYSMAAGPWFIADLLRIRRQMVEIIRKHNIDLIQTHLLAVLNFLTPSLRHRTNLQAILWTIHSVNFLPKQTTNRRFLKLRRLGHQLLYRAAIGTITGFVAVSDEVSNSMVQQLGSVQNKITIISNGVDIKRYQCSPSRTAIRQQLNLDPASYLAIFVGRLEIQKGHRYLIDAAKTVVSHHPRTHFLFIGEGELKAEVQAHIEEVNLSEHIHLLGKRDDVPQLLAEADLFVLPSLWEGLPMALLEAMAAGKPIVATAVSGIKQVMIAGQTGLLVPPKDREALAQAMMQLIAEPAQAEVMGQAAKEHVIENFSAQKQAREHLALYRRLLS